MNIKTAIVAAAAAVPAILFAGSGTAQAEADVVPPGVLPPLPVYDVPFYLQADAFHKLWFPGIQTGTTWDVDVECDNGGDIYDLPVVY